MRVRAEARLPRPIRHPFRVVTRHLAVARRPHAPVPFGGVHILIDIGENGQKGARVALFDGDRHPRVTEPPGFSRGKKTRAPDRQAPALFIGHSSLSSSPKLYVPVHAQVRTPGRGVISN